MHGQSLPFVTSQGFTHGKLSYKKQVWEIKRKKDREREREIEREGKRERERKRKRKIDGGIERKKGRKSGLKK